jgi:hypothetical protein
MADDKWIDVQKIQQILERGNTAEVKKTKNGIIILEVNRKIRFEDSEDEKE